MPDSRCPVHPERVVEGTCGRCGRFCCAHCTVGAHGGEERCRECHAREQAEDDVQGRSSWLARGATLLGTLGLCMPPVGLLAVVFGVLDLLLINSGASPRGGRRLALFGLGTGALGLAGWVLLLLWSGGRVIPWR